MCAVFFIIFHLVYVTMAINLLTQLTHICGSLVAMMVSGTGFIEPYYFFNFSFLMYVACAKHCLLLLIFIASSFNITKKIEKILNEC